MAAFTHVLLVVDQLESAVTFVSRYCGLRVVLEHTRPESGQRVTWMSREAGDPAIILVEGPEVEAPMGPYGHVGISCDDITEFELLLSRAGYDGVIERGPATQPWPIGRWFSLRGPAGHRMEVSLGQRMEDAP
jgi:catechol 2,3-dioxygenase-like lactoylglutathione lyase family enzyme